MMVLFRRAKVFVLVVVCLVITVYINLIYIF